MKKQKLLLLLLVIIPLYLNTSFIILAHAKDIKQQKQPQTNSTHTTHTPKSHVYCLRGIFDVLSVGIFSLTDKLNQQSGIVAKTFSYRLKNHLTAQIIKEYKQHKISGPIVLVGHSLGADAAVEISKKLKQANIPVSLVISLDNTKSKTIPSNVKTIYHLSSGASRINQKLFGWGNPYTLASSSTEIVKLNADKMLKNYSINHYNIDKHPAIHRFLIDVIKKQATI